MSPRPVNPRREPVVELKGRTSDPLVGKRFHPQGKPKYQPEDVLIRDGQYVLLTDLPTIAFFIMKKLEFVTCRAISRNVAGRSIQQCIFRDPENVAEGLAAMFMTHEHRDFYDAISRAKTALNQFHGKVPCYNGDHRKYKG